MKIQMMKYRIARNEVTGRYRIEYPTPYTESWAGVNSITYRTLAEAKKAMARRYEEDKLRHAKWVPVDE